MTNTETITGIWEWGNIKENSVGMKTAFTMLQFGQFKQPLIYKLSTKYRTQFIKNIRKTSTNPKTGISGYK